MDFPKLYDSILSIVSLHLGRPRPLPSDYLAKEET
jgi:hypothetical protein